MEKVWIPVLGFLQSQSLVFISLHFLLEETQMTFIHLLMSSKMDIFLSAKSCNHSSLFSMNNKNIY